MDIKVSSKGDFLYTIAKDDKSVLVWEIKRKFLAKENSI